MRCATHGPLSGLRVLVVEDADVVRQVTRWTLEAEGATVVEAQDGREAFELAATQSFDVVLTDLGLPDMSGAVVVTGIRSATHGRTPVAVVSGACQEDLAHALAAGAERAFAKPVDLDDLVGYLALKLKAIVQRNARATPQGGAKMTLLIIEDDREMRALLGDVLERAGHRVIERPDGTDLPMLTERERFDAVILDKEMPGPDGLDLLSFLRTRLPDVAVIVVTAFGGPDVADEAVRRGAYRYLDKPFRVSAILDVLAGVPKHALRVEFGREV